MRFLYLHGFVSSPASAKARFFAEKFAQLGIALEIPDFNQPDFFHLTLSRQLQQLEASLDGSPTAIIGASFGGLAALWLAERWPQVERILLLAPGLRISENLIRKSGEPRLQEWREQGRRAFFHAAWKREEWLNYDFWEDIQRYPDHALQRQLPTLLIHGRDDDTIPLRHVVDFAASRPWIDLRVLDTDHMLSGQFDYLWQAAREFFRI